MGCNGCAGSDRAGCCDPVQLVFTQDQLRQVGPGAVDSLADYEWILNDLTRIPYREGLARAPHLNQGGITMGLGLDGEVVMVHPVFYECRWYDKATKQCGNYANRPPICADYPWYGGPPDPTKAIPLDCSYRDDLRSVPPATPLPSPRRRR